MTFEVVFAPEAQLDLLDLYDMIAENGGGERALAYVERVQAACLRLAVFPDAAPGATISGRDCV